MGLGLHGQRSGLHCVILWWELQYGVTGSVKAAGLWKFRLTEGGVQKQTESSHLYFFPRLVEDVGNVGEIHRCTVFWMFPRSLYDSLAAVIAS